MVTSDSARRSGGDAGAVSAFVDNGAVRLHALDNGRLNASPPVLVVPGMGEYADEYAWMLDRIGHRRRPRPGRQRRAAGRVRLGGSHR